MKKQAEVIRKAIHSARGIKVNENQRGCGFLSGFFILLLFYTPPTPKKHQGANQPF